MKPIGKTYLIRCEHKSDVKMHGGIYIPTNFDVDEINDIFYQGEVIAHGNGYSNNDIQNLVPIGKNVIFDYHDKSGIKMTFGKVTYYIKDEDKLLGIIEDE